MTIQKKMLRILFTIILIDQTYLTLTVPLLTIIFFDTQSLLFSSDTDIATRSFWYGTCVALPNFINLFFTPLLGILSDHLGRKKILLIEIASAFIFTFLLGLGAYTGSLALVFLGVIIKGAFSRTNPTALAIIGDTTTRDKKILYMSYLQLIISIGASIGPILGGYLAQHFFSLQFNFSIPFFIAALFAFMNIMLTYKVMPETHFKKTTDSLMTFTIGNIKTVLKNQYIWQISCLLLFIQISWSTYYQFMPPILKTVYHFDSDQLGWFVGMIAVWLAFASGVVMRLLHRYFDAHQIFLISLYLLLFGFGLTLFACQYTAYTPLIWIGALPIAAGDVMAYSCLVAWYSNVAEQESQGKVMGISFIVVGFVWASTAFIGGRLMSLSLTLPLLLAPAGILVTLFLTHSIFGKKWVLSHG